jgi:hypothetical protein
MSELLTGRQAKLAILRWCWDSSLTIYKGIPGKKFARKYYDPEGVFEDDRGWFDFERWDGKDGFPLLIRVPAWLLVADADPPKSFEELPGWEWLADHPLPEPHLWLRSTRSLGEKHFLTVTGPGKRVLRAPRSPSGRKYALDLITNPEDQILWVKVWDAGYEICPGPMPQAPGCLTRLLKRDPPPRPSGPRQYPAGQAGTRYGEGILYRELDRLLRAPVGTRSHQLNVAAFVLGPLADAGLLDEERTRDLLQDAGEHTGLTPAEVRTTIRSGWNAGIRKARVTA